MEPDERIRRFFYNTPSGNSEIMDEHFKPYIPRPSDVIVVGAIKSGTTWLQQIVHQIRTKGDENFKDLYEVSPWLPVKPVKGYVMDINAEQVANPRVYKVHDRYDVIPTCDGTKLIFITRDPYDRQWSFMKFFYRWMGGNEDTSEEMALEMFGEIGALGAGNDTFQVLLSWYPHRQDPGVLWIHFEDLKSDLRFCMKKIAEFIQVPITDDELSRAYHFCTFEYMAKNEKRFSGETPMKCVANAIGCEPWISKCGTVRTDGGRVGDGKGLSPRLKEAIDKKWKDTVKKELAFPDYQALYKEMSFLKRCGRYTE